MHKLTRKLGLVLFAAAIAALFIAASTSVSGNSTIRGRVVVDKPGTFTVGQDINLLADNNSSSVIKVTSGGVVIDCDGHALTGPPGSPVIDLAPTTNTDQLITLRDCRINGGLHGVRATNASARYENMIVIEAVSHGLESAASDLEIVGTRIRTSGGSAIHMTGSNTSGVRIEDSIINGTVGNAIDAHGQLALDVVRTTIREAGGCGLMIANDTGSGAGAGLTVEDSIIVGTGRDGWHIVGDTPVVIRGGRVKMVARNAVYVNGSDQPVSIRDVAAQDVGALGIKVHGGGATEIVGNRIRMVGQAVAHGGGIEIDGAGGPAQVATIANNTITSGGADSCAIRVLEGTTARIVDNVAGGTTYGVSTWMDDGVIEGNQIRRVDVAGIRVFGSGNVVRTNNVYGKWFAGGGLAERGVFVGPAASGNLVEDNQIRWFTTGLRIDGLDDSCFYRDNLLTGNSTAVSGGTDKGGNISP